MDLEPISGDEAKEIVSRLETIYPYERDLEDQKTEFLAETNPVHKFMTVEFVPHRPALWFLSFGTREELEAHVIGPSGLANTFTGDILCFELGRRLKYEITYEDEDGSTVVFSKQGQEVEERFYSNYPDLRVHWLA